MGRFLADILFLKTNYSGISFFSLYFAQTDQLGSNGPLVEKRVSWPFMVMSQ